MRPQSTFYRSLVAVVFAALALGGAACGPSRTAEQAKSDLASSDAEARLKASRDIETEARLKGSLPADVLDDVLAKVAKEPDAKVKGSMVITLGYVGDPRAKPIIDAYVQTQDPDQQRWAARALKKYETKTGKVAADYVFPKNYPYGQPGFPAPASN